MPFRPTAHPHISQKNAFFLVFVGTECGRITLNRPPAVRIGQKKTAASTAETIAAVWKD